MSSQNAKPLIDALMAMPSVHMEDAPSAIVTLSETERKYMVDSINANPVISTWSVYVLMFSPGLSKRLLGAADLRTVQVLADKAYRKLAELTTRNSSDLTPRLTDELNNLGF